MLKITHQATMKSYLVIIICDNYWPNPHENLTNCEIRSSWSLFDHFTQNHSSNP